MSHLLRGMGNLARGSQDGTELSNNLGLAGFSAEEQVSRLLGEDLGPRTSDIGPLPRPMAGLFKGLGSESNPEIFFQDLFQIGQKAEDKQDLQLASTVFSYVSQNATESFLRKQAEARLAGISGQGGTGAGRLEHLSRSWMDHAFDPAALAGMSAAGLAFQSGKLFTMARLWGRAAPQTLRMGGALGGFAVEVPAFVAVTKGASVAMGREVDWSANAWKTELISGAMVLGALKLSGFASGSGINKFHGVNPITGQATRYAQWLPTTRTIGTQTGMLGGIMTGHSIEAAYFGHETPDGANNLLDSLATLLQFNLAGKLTPMMAPRAHALSQQLGVESHRLSQTRSNQWLPDFLKVRSPMSDVRGLSPAMATAGASTVHSPKGPKATDHILKMQKVDPHETLGVLPMGSVTPYGNEKSTHSRAVGDPEWVAQVAEINGDVQYKGDGKYVDAKTGESVELSQILEEFTEKSRQTTGFQSLESQALLPFYEQDGKILDPFTREALSQEQAAERFALKSPEVALLHRSESGTYRHSQTGEEFSVKDLEGRFGRALYGEPSLIKVQNLPLQTDWAGQLPPGLRGEEGQTETKLLEVMGLSKRDIRQLAFKDSGTYITTADAFALQGLYALYRSAVQWGARLDELVGHDPRRMAIAVGSGLGGMNNFIDIIRASHHREIKKGLATEKTSPVTKPNMLPSLLIDSMQGVFTAILGPKGNTFDGPVTPDTIVRTLGRNPVDVGACATGYKALIQAADLFRPAWPGALETELAIFGSSERAHGKLFGRPEATGFNAMRAMETRAQLEKRNGNLEDSYAPLSDQVGGFWPSEGAGMGGLMRLDRLMELGLPTRAALVGYSMAGDQGGKKNAAGLGLGGMTTLQEALNMARHWQRIRPESLQYLSGHFTGTPNNNQVETGNLAQVLRGFGHQGPLKVSAFKALLGHGLGAAGSMEAALLLSSLERQVAPGVFNLTGKQLDAHVRELAGLLEVSAQPLTGPIDFVGGQSQGFGGNNAAALFRRLSPRSLEEFYGYSQAEIAAYQSRRSERTDRAREWEESIRKGEKTIGEFLSWFGLGSQPSPKQSFVDLAPGEKNSGPVGEVEIGAPAIRKGIVVDPAKMAVSVGRGSMLTTRGTTLATRSAAMNGVDHPLTIAYLAEDYRLVRYAGRNDAGLETWVRTQDGAAITLDQLSHEFGPQVLSTSGMREIPLQGKAAQLPVRHGGLIPDPLRGTEAMMNWMGLGRSHRKGTPLANQDRNFRYASAAGAYGLWAGLEAHLGLGRPLYEWMTSSRFGAAQGSAAPGIERWVEMYLNAAQKGKDSLTYVLQSALLENPRGLYLNTILPHLDFLAEVVKGGNREALQRIVPDGLPVGQKPNTGGVNTAFSQACAAGLYALWGARKAMIHEGVPGEYPMDAMMVMGSDATFAPYDTAPMVGGFSRKAPMTLTSMVGKLAGQGLLPPDAAREMDSGEVKMEEIWANLSPELRKKAMDEASAPFTKYSDGLVVAEASAALPWMNFRRAVELGIFPSSRLLGIHVAAGEGGAPNLASMDQGIVTASMVALEMGLAHGVKPDVIQAHGTSTKLNNTAEIQSVYRAFRYLGMDHEMSISAVKGLVGHPMGAASAVDMVMGVQSLLDQRAPGLFNFRLEDIDPRYAEKIPEALQQFKFSSEPIEGMINGILILSEGFLSSNAAALFGSFPQEVDVAADMLRDYNFAPHEIADWKVRAQENRARAEENAEKVRRGEWSHLDVALELGFNP